MGRKERVTTLEAPLLEVVGDVPDEKVAQQRPQWTPFGGALGKDPERGVTGVIETAPVDVVWLTGWWVLKSPVRSCVFAGTVSFVLSFVFSWFLFVTIMGQAQVTPKTLLLNHFPEIRAKARNYGVEVKKVCQKLLKTLFTTEERERILTEARKNVPGDNGRPTTLPNLINERFPLNRPDWDFGDAEGRECLRVYRQTLTAGLRAAARRPTNLAKVKAIMQGENESPAVFLECLYDTPLDPLAEENQSAVIMSFINQAAPNIRKKLYKQEGLGEMSIRDLMKVVERVFNTQETPEEREDRIRKENQELQERIRKEDTEHQSRENRRQQREMAKILLAGMQGTVRLGPSPAGPARPWRPRPQLDAGQCANCKEYGHWKRECPKRQGQTGQDARVLLAGMDSD
ncbi:hypothetical protein mRhiFer1_008834 [Rhinolophus ferrumequinum]|uniref:CCHC-type domain-containing protein n=1 Tax=Rhinolophus ferrumequinum TaxID=59479 RepID=A0A7J8AF29_RHIFE|nr:hypothetical protein mRhiFer1_008834 [Rhinolophus ferrumequinum]